MELFFLFLLIVLMAAALGSGFVKEAVGFEWLAYFATATAAGILVFALATDRSTEPIAAEAL